MNWMELKIGDQIAEYAHGRKVSSTVKTEPRQDGAKITFTAETEDGRTIDYLMTVGRSAHTPNIHLENNEVRHGGPDDTE